MSIMGTRCRVYLERAAGPSESKLLSYRGIPHDTHDACKLWLIHRPTIVMGYPMTVPMTGHDIFGLQNLVFFESVFFHDVKFLVVLRKR